MACREGELESSRETFRLAQRGAHDAATHLEQALTQLEVHRQEGQKQLQEIQLALKDLIKAVRLSPVSTVPNFAFMCTA